MDAKSPLKQYLLKKAKEADPALSCSAPATGWAVYENEEGGFEIIDRQGRSVLTDVYAYDSTDFERETRMEWIVDALNAYSKQPNANHEDEEPKEKR